MDDKRFKELLDEGFLEYGYELNEEKQEKVLRYKNLLQEWNKVMNLTAILDDKEIIVKHFLDSVSILPFIPKECENFADIGTGAGFPGIPVKIMLDDIDVALIDSLAKRVKFLNTVCDELNLKGISAIHGRAEDLGRDGSFREKYDVCSARAVAKLNVLLEYCLPFVKVGGIFIAMKGNCEEEIEASHKALKVLGGEIINIKEEILPKSDVKRNIIIIKKFRQTPTSYPRKAGKPSKHPLV